MIRQEDGYARRQPDEPAPAQHVDPRARPVEVTREVARGEERTDRLAGCILVVGRSAHERHRLVEQRHPLAEAPGLDVREPTVRQRFRLEVHVPEATSSIESELCVGEKHVRIVDVAAHRRDRYPSLLDARRLVLDQPLRP